MATHCVEQNSSAPVSWYSAPEPPIIWQDLDEHTASESSAFGSSSSEPSTPEQPAVRPIESVKPEEPSDLFEPLQPVEPVEPVESVELATPKETKPGDKKTPDEGGKPVYMPREDRLNQTPTKGNAQGLFLPACCVFVGK